MTSLLRRKRPITPRNIGKSSISAAGIAITAGFILAAMQIVFSASAFATDSTTTDDAASSNHENKLRWLPYRPDQKSADTNDGQCKSCSESQCKKCTDSQCKSDSSCKSCTDRECKACSESQCKNCSESKDNSSTAPSVAVKRVHRAAAEETASLPTKIRLTSAEESDASPALNDPFSDIQAPAANQQPIAITPDDVQESAQTQSVQVMPANRGLSQRAPAEFHSSEPLPLRRGGASMKSVKAYQASEPTPGPGPESYQPESNPNYDPQTRRALQNPAEDCRAAYDKLKASSLDKVSLDIKVAGQPGNDVPYECSLTTDSFNPRCWQLTTYTWKSSCLCHKPLYFEEEALERYGHSHGWICEDLVSCAHFFGNVALLPYHVGVETPCECIYDLGVYRVGDCAPYMCDPFPLSVRGACTAAVGYGAVIALFP